MKKNYKRIVASTLVCILLTSGVVFAKQFSESITVIYDNIKLIIDGTEFRPTDASGNTVEPFIYNGTTYLPVRAIANAFDKNVGWDAESSTITLETKNEEKIYNRLDRMVQFDYKSTGNANHYESITEATLKSNNWNYGLVFYLRDNISTNASDNGSIKHNDNSIECYQHITYLLDGQYSNFEGIIACDIAYIPSQIKFYGDGNLLYASPVIAPGMKDESFNIDVSDVKKLQIQIDALNPFDGGKRSYPCIANAKLIKK